MKELEVKDAQSRPAATRRLAFFALNYAAFPTVSEGNFEAITSTVKAKYGLMVPIMRLVDSVRHLGKGPFPYADTGVVITLQG